MTINFGEKILLPKELRKRVQTLNKISSMHDTKKKKKSNEKSDVCLSIEVFIDFGANRAHSVNMGNESGGSFTNFAN